MEQATTPTTQIDGYSVVATDNENIPYELHGPRGAHYGLMRNAHNRHALFAINMRKFGVVERLGWFSDKDGTLRRIRS